LKLTGRLRGPQLDGTIVGRIEYELLAVSESGGRDRDIALCGHS
jgi:hypothetical protein